MSHIGYTASRLNIFLSVPPFIRGLTQSIYQKSGLGLTFDYKYMLELRNVDPLDPTRIVDKYRWDWWNHEKNWREYPMDSMDLWEAFSWHIKKVCVFFFLSWH